MNQYLIPANSKKSMLIFGLFNVTDLVMFGIGIGITLLLLPVLPINNWIFALIAIAPAAVTGFLVFPVANYHNVRTLIGEVYNYYFVNRRKYIWRGWCYTYEQSDE